MLKFWLPTGQEIFLPPETVEVLVTTVPHEAGHAEVAAHFGARVLGIAIANEPNNLRAMALFNLPKDMRLEDVCTVCAAGAAGEKLFLGNTKKEMPARISGTLKVSAKVTAPKYHLRD
jgi:hypothetical protein